MLPFQVLLFQDFTLGLCVLLAVDHVVIILVAVVQDLVLVLQHWDLYNSGQFLSSLGLGTLLCFYLRELDLGHLLLYHHLGKDGPSHHHVQAELVGCDHLHPQRLVTRHLACGHLGKAVSRHVAPHCRIWAYYGRYF